MIVDPPSGTDDARRMRFAWVLATVALGGCSFATLQTARPIKTGMAGVSPQFGLQLVDRSRYPGLDYVSAANRPVPQVDLAIRGGVTSHLDVGGVVGFSGVEFGIKALLTPADWSQFAIGFGPSVRGRLLLRGDLFKGPALTPILVGDLMLPLLIEWDPHEQVCLVATIKGIIIATSDSLFNIASPVASVGGSLGAGFWFTPRFGVLLEGGAYLPVYTPAGVPPPAPVLIQGAFAFRFRAGRDNSPPPPVEREEREESPPLPAPPPPPAPLPPLAATPAPAPPPPLELTPFPAAPLPPPPPAWSEPIAPPSKVGSLAISVLDRTAGAPIAGATVRAGAASGTTNAQGWVRFTDLPEGAIALAVLADGYIPGKETAVVAPGRESSVQVGLGVALQRVLATFTGLVRGTDGKPIAAQFEIPEAKFKTRASASGAFTLQLKGGRYTVNITAPGYVSQTRSLTVIDGDQAIFNVDLLPK